MHTLKITTLFLLTLSAAACQKDPGVADASQGKGVAVHLGVQPAFAASSSVPEDAIRTCTAYRFDGDVLQEVFGPLVPQENGAIYLEPSSKRGSLYFLANASSVEDLATLTPGETTLSEFLSLDASVEQLRGERAPLSGELRLDAGLATQQASLMRCTARLDLEVAVSDVRVRSLRIGGIAGRGYVFPRTEISAPESTDDSFDVHFDTPAERGRHILGELCEQPGGQRVEIVADFGGGEHRMQAVLPSQLRRNTVYTLRVYGSGSKLQAEVKDGAWDTGAGSDSELEVQGLVDVEHSTFPEGVRVNRTCDTVFVNSAKQDFELALAAPAGSRITVDGTATGVTVTPQASTRALETVGKVSVSSAFKAPGVGEQYMYLNLVRENLRLGRVVLVFESNPVKLTGVLTFDENLVCDFGTWQDGELGELTLPAGKKASVEIGKDEDPWLKLADAKNSGTTCRLLAGWRPNDPKGDGREQTATLVISDDNGGNEERYTIKRRNWALPVVQIGGRWWCRYNLRGHVKRFSDQILVTTDPAAGKSLYSHLQSCSEEDMLKLLGDQYQGGNWQGMPLHWSEDLKKFHYSGVKPSGMKSFHSLADTVMAPPGFRIPHYEDFKALSNSDNQNLGGKGSHTYTSRGGQKVAVNIVERDVTFFGEKYGIIDFYEFRVGDSATDTAGNLVLCGFGHQWDSTYGNIARMNILFATWASNTWQIEGYAESTKKGQNWLKYASHHEKKTRTIRCLKTDVEYIY